jgi:hypothetical protein
MSITKLCSLAIALSSPPVVAPSMGHPSTSEFPYFAASDRPQIDFFIHSSGDQSTDAAVRRRPVYLASLVGRQVVISVKRPTHSTLTTLFDSLFGRRENVSRPRATANLFVRGPKLESKGSKLEEMQLTQPTAVPNEKATSFITPTATPTGASPQSSIAPILTPSPTSSTINDLPTLPLE